MHMHMSENKFPLCSQTIWFPWYCSCNLEQNPFNSSPGGGHTVHLNIWTSWYKIGLGNFRLGSAACIPAWWCLGYSSDISKALQSPLTFFITSETFVSSSFSQQSFSPCCCCSTLSCIVFLPTLSCLGGFFVLSILGC